MRCEEARDLMLEREKLSFEPVDQPLFEAHLEGCEACRELYQISIGTEQLAISWQDEPVPHWDRLAHLIPRMPRWQPLLMWAPLAACVLMCFLVVSKAEVSSEKGIWQIRFGTPAQTPGLTEKQLQARLDEALKKAQEQHHNEMKTMLAAYGQHQNKQYEVLTAQITDSLRGEQNQNLAAVVNGWQDQRGKDLMWMENRFDSMMFRQQRNSSNLYKIANYVNRPTVSKERL